MVNKIIDKIIDWIISLDPIDGGDLFPKGTGCFIGCQVMFWGIILVAMGVFLGRIIWH
jgi:hypothetical protein